MYVDIGIYPAKLLKINNYCIVCHLAFLSFVLLRCIVIASLLKNEGKESVSKNSYISPDLALLFTDFCGSL